MAKIGLTGKQKRGIAALLSEPTQAEAAEAAGVGPRTLTRWLQQPKFKAALQEAETYAINEAIRHLARMQSSAANVIEGILGDEEISPTVRLRAAVSVFDLMIRLKSFNQLEERITTLEGIINESTK
jgi:phage terminase small subunit